MKRKPSRVPWCPMFLPAYGMPTCWCLDPLGSCLRWAKTIKSFATTIRNELGRASEEQTEILSRIVSADRTHWHARENDVRRQRSEDRSEAFGAVLAACE